MNTDLLQGKACPKCGYDKMLKIECNVMFEVFDDGTGDQEGSIEWDDDALTQCPKCNHSGALNTFKKTEESEDPLTSSTWAGYDHEAGEPEGFDDDDEVEMKYRNYYQCYRCNHVWTDDWDAMCDDDCPKCGARHCTPYTSEELDENGVPIANTPCSKCGTMYVPLHTNGVCGNCFVPDLPGPVSPESKQEK
jgi:rubrerythrin